MPTTNFYLPNDLYRKLDEQAKKSGDSVPVMARKIIEDFITKLEESDYIVEAKKLKEAQKQ